MQKLIIKNKDFTLELLPKKGKILKLKSLEWTKSNEELYMAKMTSLLNIYFPCINFPYPFKEIFFIRKDKEKLYYISTHRKSEYYFNDINPIFTLKEAKTICQNLAEDLYDIGYGNSFYIE